MFVERGFDAVTIADIAKGAEVAVQTVFNHFATKEELFFDGRTPWVDGPARAVRTREAGVSPLVALRAYLVDEIGVEPRRVAASAYSQFRPRSRNRARNRRIEVLLTPIVKVEKALPRD